MTADDDPVDVLAESFLAALRRGESPSVDHYVERLPAHAERILNLFPMLEALERVSQEIDPKSEAAVPERLGEYRILRKIGRGGMGTVCEAVQEPLGRHVALKIMAAGPHSHPTLLERFQREARTAARLHHGNIVPVFGVGVDRGVYYFAMQYIVGQSLDKVIAELVQLRPEGTVESAPSSGFLSSNEARYHQKVAGLIAQVADALAYAHGRGVLHRDIKPANLLLDDKGTLWLADFGLAKEAMLGDDLTNTGDVLGTLRYLAPERLRGIADERGDIYSLGATLFELATLTPIYDAPDRHSLVRQVADGHIRPPRDIDPSIPVDLETVILKTLAREPSARYQSAGDLAEDLRNVIADRPIRARKLSKLARLRRWAWQNPLIAGLTASVLVLIGLVALVSTVYSLQLRRSLTEIQRAERRANEKVLDSLIEQADANRRSQQPGQRCETIRILQDAARQADSLGILTRNDRIRDLALAAIAMPDIAVVQKIESAFTSAAGSIWSDAEQQTYAISDTSGTRIRRWRDQQIMRTLPVSNPSIVRVSRDGRFVAAWRMREDCVVFDLARSDDLPIASLRQVFRTYFANQNSHIVAVHLDGSITVCDLPAGTRRETLPAAGMTRETTLALHPTRTWLAATSYFNNRVLVRDYLTGERVADWQMPDSCFEATWSPDGRRLALPCTNRKIYIHSAGDWQQESSLEGSVDGRGEFDGTGEYFFQNGWGHRYTLWRRTQPQFIFRHPANEPAQMAVGERGEIFAIEAQGRACVRYELATGRERIELRPSTILTSDFSLTGVAIHPAGRLVVASSGEGLFLWDLATGRELPNCFGRFQCNLPNFASDGSLIVSGGRALWRFPQLTAKDAAHLQFGAPQCVTSLPFEHFVMDNDGRRFLLHFRQVGKMQPFTGDWLIDRHGLDRGINLHPGRESTTHTISPNGNWIIGSVDGKTSIRALPCGQPVGSWAHGSSTFSSDGRLVAWQTDETTIWETAPEFDRWRKLSSIPHVNPKVLFSPDNRLVAMESDLRSVLLFDVQTGRQRARLDSQHVIGQVRFSPDGAMLIATHQNNTISVWNLAQLRIELRRVALDCGAEPFPDFPRSSVAGVDQPLNVSAVLPLVDDSKVSQVLSRCVGDIGIGPVRQFARTMDRLGYYGAANAAFVHLHNTQPDDPEACYHLGLAAVERRDWSAAVRHLEVAAAHPQLHDIARLVASVVLRHDNRSAEADDQLKLLRTLEPELTATFWSEAMTFFEQARYGPAALLFEEAVLRDPKSTMALHNGALLYCHPIPGWSDPAKSLNWAQRGRLAAPNRSLGSIEEAWALTQLQRYAEARNMAKQLADHGEDVLRPSALHLVALCEIALDRPDHALRAWHLAESAWVKEGLSGSPHIPDVYLRAYRQIRRDAHKQVLRIPAAKQLQ